MSAFSFNLIQANIVVLADSFNPSIATKDWLRDNLIHEEPPVFINTPLVSVFETPEVHLLIDQSRLQLTFKILDSNVMQKWVKLVAYYVELLPHTPYKAVGFNFVWEVIPPTLQSGTVTCYDRCSCGETNWESVFDEYSSEPNVLGRRGEAVIRLGVEPSLDIGNSRITTVNFHYNYQNAERISEAIGGLLDAVSDSRNFVTAIFPENVE